MASQLVNNDVFLMDELKIPQALVLNRLPAKVREYDFDTKNTGFMFKLSQNLPSY